MNRYATSGPVKGRWIMDKQERHEKGPSGAPHSIAALGIVMAMAFSAYFVIGWVTPPMPSDIHAAIVSMPTRVLPGADLLGTLMGTRQRKSGQNGAEAAERGAP